MLAKCANPWCFRLFLNLREGRLFRLEADAASSDSPTVNSSSTVEYFWLCDVCSASITLRLDEKGGVAAEPLERANRNPRFFAVISRRKGMLLRSVSTNPEGTSGSPGRD